MNWRDINLRNWARLYENPTKAELAMEPAVAALGLPYRFQHRLLGGKIFPDFVILPLKVIVEIDGKSHRETKQIAIDVERTKRLKKHGWSVVRISNEDAISNPHQALKAALLTIGL